MCFQAKGQLAPPRHAEFVVVALEGAAAFHGAESFRSFVVFISGVVVAETLVVGVQVDI